MNIVRLDTVSRRRQLLEAADEVFNEHGLHAPLELVVERSGLGRATLYRAFPDRTALMSALLERGLEAFERAAADLGEREDGLAVLLYDVADHIAESAPLVDFWRAMERTHPTIEAADLRALAVFMPYVRRAIVAGTCRPDLDEEQMLLVLDMLGSSLRGGDFAERRRAARRAAALLLRGMGVPE